MIVGPSLFTLGAAAGHVRQMTTEHNFAPGNASIIFYTDIIIPLFGSAAMAGQGLSRQVFGFICRTTEVRTS